MRSPLVLLPGLSNRLHLRGALLKCADCFSWLGSKNSKAKFYHGRRGVILQGLKQITRVLCPTSFQEMFCTKMFRRNFLKHQPSNTCGLTPSFSTAGKLNLDDYACWGSSSGAMFLSSVMSSIKTKLVMMLASMRPIFRTSVKGAFCVTFHHPLG